MNFRIILFAYISLFSLGLLDNTRGPIYVEILQFFEISKSIGSLIFSLSSLSAFLVSIFATRWLQLFGATGATKLGLFFHFISFVLMGISPSGEIGLILFLFASLVFGLGMGIMSISLNIMIAESSNPFGRRRIFSGLHAMYGVASLLAPFIVGKIVGPTITWQHFLIILSFIPLLFILFNFNLSGQVKKSLGNDKKKIKDFKGIIPFSCVLALYISGELLVGTRLVIYLKEIKLLGHEESNNILSLFFFFLLLGRMIFAIKKFEIKTEILLSLSATISAISLIGGILYWPYLLALSGLGMSFFFPCCMDWIGEIYGENVDFVISKVMMFAGGFIVFIHWFFGQLAGIIGLENTFWIAPIFHLLVLYILQLHFRFLAKSN